MVLVEMCWCWTTLVDGTGAGGRLASHVARTLRVVRYPFLGLLRWVAGERLIRFVRCRPTKRYQSPNIRKCAIFQTSSTGPVAYFLGRAVSLNCHKIPSVQKRKHKHRKLHNKLSNARQSRCSRHNRPNNRYLRKAPPTAPSHHPRNHLRRPQANLHTHKHLHGRHSPTRHKAQSRSPCEKHRHKPQNDRAERRRRTDDSAPVSLLRRVVRQLCRQYDLGRVG